MDKFYLSSAKVLQTFETLIGLIDGITADGKIHSQEVKALRHWLSEHDHIRNYHPFGEVIRIIELALQDNILSTSELADIKYLCYKILSLPDLKTLEGTTQTQRLHGIASGIAADNEIHPKEWDFLSNWIQSNENLKGSWPYDEIEALITKHLSTQELSSYEKRIIVHYLKDFCGFNNNSALSHPLNEPGKAITGICAVCPEVTFFNKTFCFTGISEVHSRDRLVEIVSSLRGHYKKDISKSVDYLVVCAEGSPMWTYSCYGRKVEEAIHLRKRGHKILIVHEHDFLDSLEDVA